MNANGSLHNDFGAQTVGLNEHKAGGDAFPNLQWVNVDVPDPTPENPDGGAITWTFLLVNAGHVGSGFIDVFNKASDAFAGAFAGEVVGGNPAALAGVATVLGVQELVNLLTADCDGTVAVGAFSLTAAQLAGMAPTPPQVWSTTQDNPGTNSPPGCGSNSDYVVTYQIFNASVVVEGEELCVTRDPNHMDVFWVHPDGSINSTWWDANVANGAWELNRVFAATPPGKAAGGPVAVVARTPNHMDLFWVHPDGSINSTWWDANVANGAWDPTRVFAATPPGKAAGGSIAVVARTPNHMDLFWVHPDGSINSTWWDANVANGAWDPTRVFAATPPGEAAGGPVAVVARTPNHMDLFWVHPDGSINSTWWDANVANGAWDPTRVFAATPPGKAAGGSIAVVARTPNHMDLFWVHPDGSINSTWWDANVANGAWDPTRVFAATPPGKAAGGPVAVVARTPNHMDLFWVHSDGSINSTWWDADVANDAWELNRVFAATAPGKAVTRLVSVIARAPTHMDVFWVHPDGSINSTWWDANVANGAWELNRVFAATPPGANR